MKSAVMVTLAGYQARINERRFDAVTPVIGAGDQMEAPPRTGSPSGGDGRRRIVAIAGAGGNVGCSVLAAAVARALHGATDDGRVGVRRRSRLGIAGISQPTTRVRSRHDSVVLVDADRFGGGLDVLFGVENLPGARWPAVVAAGSGVPASDVQSALPMVGPDVSLLSMGREVADIDLDFATVLIEGFAAHADVVVDISRDWDSDIAHAALLTADLVVLVMTSHVRSCAAALAFLERQHHIQAARGSVVAAVREVQYGAAVASLKRAMPIPLVARIPASRTLARMTAAGVPGAIPPQKLISTAAQILTGEHG